MTHDRRQYSGNAPATTLSSGIDNSTLTIPLTSGTGYPDGSVGNFYIVIDRGISTEEKILCDTRATNTITALTRGTDGTSAFAHSSGAAVEHVWTKTDADEANSHYADTTLDHHTQYSKTDGTRAFTGVTAIAAAPAASAVGDTQAAGTATTLARSDHRHAREAFGLPAASAPGDAQAAGVATTVSRSDHVHARESAGAAWTAYTPTWSSDSSPQPVIGNGSIVAAYRQIGKTLDIRLILTAGSTTTFGTDGWLFSLPGVLTSLVEQITGSALGFNASSGERVGGGTAYLAASGTAFRIFGETSPQADSWKSSVPFVWANADKLYVKAMGIEVT